MNTAQKKIHRICSCKNPIFNKKAAICIPCRQAKASEQAAKMTLVGLGRGKDPLVFEVCRIDNHEVRNLRELAQRNKQ